MAILIANEPLLLSAKQLELVKKQYGVEALTRVSQWQDMLIINKDQNEFEKLTAVNDFINKMKFVSDLSHWGSNDYWSTPIEFLATAGGDCEDFTIAKYFSLRRLGLDIDKLRLVYVKATSINQAHMVLAYYESADTEPLILDNLDKMIKPASERSDLIPSYSFNGNNLWASRKLRDSGQKVGKSRNIGLWSMLMLKMSQEK